MAEDRDFVLARLAMCRASLAAAAGMLDDALGLYLDPSEDKDGGERKGLLEGVDGFIGEAARAVQAAQELADDIDPKEGEPELPEDDGLDPDEEDEDGDEGDDDK